MRKNEVVQAPDIAVRAAPTKFVLLVYRMPARPTAGRVAVWRMLKKIGAIYLQQSVCVFPDTPPVRRELAAILTKIEEARGGFHLLPVNRLSLTEQQKLAAQFVDQTAKHYREIIENCEVNFQKEVEFETFRKNFTYEEAEEIRTEFDKIVGWFRRVRDRDWFGAPIRVEAESWLHTCERLVEDFEARVFIAQDAETLEAGIGPAGADRTRYRRSKRSANGPTVG